MSGPWQAHNTFFLNEWINHCRLLFSHTCMHIQNIYMEVKWKWRSLSCVWLFGTPWTIQSMEFSRPEYWSGYPFPSPGNFPNPGTEPRSPELQADSLPAEPQGKPKNTGVGSLFLLQQIVLTQELNQGLLHCRWILYQLSYQGNIYIYICFHIYIFFHTIYMKQNRTILCILYEIYVFKLMMDFGNLWGRLAF